MKTNLEEKQKELIAHYEAKPINDGAITKAWHKWNDRKLYLKELIAELEKQGTELPPVEQPGKSAEEVLENITDLSAVLFSKEPDDILITPREALKAMKEYRTAGMPSEEEINKELSNYLYKLTTPLDDYQKFRIEVAWEYIAKWIIDYKR